jgi:hypothetical protein
MNHARRSMIVLVVSGLLTSVATNAATAQGGKGGSSIRLVARSADGLAHFEGQVTFAVRTSVAEPWVNVKCYQGDMWVYGEWHGFFASYGWGQTFTLGPTPSWQSGDADCTARVVKFGRNGRQSTLATTNFPAYDP